MSINEFDSEQYQKNIILDYQNRADDYAENHQSIKKAEKVKRMLILIFVGTLSLVLLVLVLSRVSQIG
jgi:hypothetical protein